MIIGGESCSKGHEFESRHPILDGFFHNDLLQKLQCVFERTKINEKKFRIKPQPQFCAEFRHWQLHCKIPQRIISAFVADVQTKMTTMGAFKLEREHWIGE